MRIAAVEPTAEAIAAASPRPARLVGVGNAASASPIYHFDVGGRPGYPAIRIVIELDPGERLAAGDHVVHEPPPRRRPRR